MPVALHRQLLVTTQGSMPVALRQFLLKGDKSSGLLWRFAPLAHPYGSPHGFGCDPCSAPSARSLLCTSTRWACKQA
eukprot:8405117-Alexandrium_andersonii.AAC.1